MKTNQIIKRPMGSFVVEQRTKDGMFNATAFVNQWNDIHKSSVNVSDIINDYNDFCKMFIPSDGCVSGISKEDVYWVDEFTFRNILCYISPELSLVDFPCMLYDIHQLPIPHNKDSHLDCKNTIHTYLFTDKSGLFKIGKSRNVGERFRSLSIGSPSLQKVLVIPFDVEKELHVKFDNKRVVGEWFKLDKEDLLYLHSLVEKYTC